MSLPAISCVYFGMAGAFSRPPLEALLRAGVAVCAVALPALPGASVTNLDAPFAVLPRPASAAGRRALPLLTPARDTDTDADTILQIAAARNIPVLELRRLNDPRTIAALTAFAPDVICVACFSRRIPSAILRAPRLGCLNVHPSLLPANRGSDPLFWTFRNGDAETGVTIHVMDEGLDSGPIVAQRTIPVAEGISKSELEHICAAVGGELLVEALRGLAEGRLTPQPQDARLATTYPWPSADDYVIMSDRPARWAYAFARGVATQEHLIRIVTP
ncbi:MAG TPA: methionyl-tRNA formyltransferase, partial [Ktedonobacterales bacterium]|nr:methionyl-tRNA formyltransferase [Ktedonobacterales bacterium]